jgi:peptidoglycan hydrolase-like protein with peptidoglycan-binding domain
MTLTKDLTAKFAVAIVAVAMVFGAFASSAKAETTEDLQKMINDLLAQVAALQSQTGQGGTSVASGVCPYTWTRDLNVGATGGDVMKLQMFLNADLDTRVAAEGAGSVGMETEFYGPATAAAVSKLQVKYRADILSPANLVNPTGYFGPSTRAKANSLCAVAPVVDDMDDEEATDEEATDEEDEDMDLGGEASLDDFGMDASDEDEYEEGAEDAAVAEATYEFQDGDAEISRIDVQLVGSGDEQDPWDTFEEVSLWVDGDKVADVDASDEDNYLGDEDDGILRFSGLDLVAMEDEELEVVVAVTVNSSIDLGGDADAWTVAILNTRFFDADGVATTLDDGDDVDFGATESFTIDEAGFEDEIIAKSSSNDPDATTLQVEDNKKSDWYTVFVFDLDTDDSTNDLELNELVINIATSGATYSALVDDAELVIDGVTIDDVDVVSTGDEAELTFNIDGDVTIDAGDRVAAELKLRFRALTAEGATVQASVDGSTIDAEGADDVTGTGAATGEEHTLRTTGIEVELDSTDADVEVVDGDDNDYATFKIVVDVTAFEQDVFIPLSSASTSLKLVDENGNEIVGAISASSTVVITSSAEEGGAGDAFFEINEGETESVTITVTFTPETAGSQAARLVLNSLVFDETGTASGADDETWTALPATTYRTDVVTLTN